MRTVRWIVEKKNEVIRSWGIPYPKYGSKTLRIRTADHRGHGAFMMVGIPTAEQFGGYAGILKVELIGGFRGSWRGSGAVLEQN